MVNFKKMDEKDFVFINRQISKREEKEFSEFLKARRAKSAAKRVRTLTRRKKHLA